MQTRDGEKYMKGKLGLGLTLFGLLKMRVGMIIKEGVIFFMLHNNYTQQNYKSYHVILQADPEHNMGELLLGDLNAATDTKLLEQHNVKTIITAAAGLQHLAIPPQQTHIVFPLLDLKNQNIDTYFQVSNQTIDSNLKRGSVLVHCGAGISRSATLVIAYYMKKYDPHFLNALRFVRKIRPSVCPNLGFQLQLKKYQERLGNNEESRTSNIHKHVSMHETNEKNRNNVKQAKKMMLTFNAPTETTKNARMDATNTKKFSAKTPMMGHKVAHYPSQKRAKIEQGGLFIEGRTAVGQLKNESTYDPQRYWHKGSVTQKKESSIFKT